MRISARVFIGLVVFVGAVALGATLVRARLPHLPGGPNRVCNGSFEEGGFVKEGEIGGQDFMHVNNPSDVMSCAAAPNRWRASRPGSSGPKAVVWLQFQGAPPAGVEGKRIVDLTGLYDTPPFGAVSQEFQTAPGSRYEVSLTLINDPTFPPPSVTITVLNSGNPPTNPRAMSFTAPRPVSQIQGYRAQFVFTADSAMTLLQIKGNGPDRTIPIDDVSVRVFCVFGLDVFCR